MILFEQARVPAATLRRRMVRKESAGERSARGYGPGVRVYVSPDKEYRVQVSDSGPCWIYQSGSKVHTCYSEPEAVKWLIAQGVKQLERD